MDIFKKIDKAISETFSKDYIAFDYEDVQKVGVDHEYYNDQESGTCKILVHKSDHSASYVYDTDLLLSKILTNLCGNDVSKIEVDNNDVLTLEVDNYPFYFLNPYGDGARCDECFFYQFAYLYKNRAHVVDIFTNGIEDNKAVITTEHYVTSQELPIPPESLNGKAPYYMYREVGISLRVHDTNQWNNVPENMRHSMAKNWSPKERLFMLMEKLESTLGN